MPYQRSGHIRSKTVRMSGYGRVWRLVYAPGARTGDVYVDGTCVDCVQVREWDWRRGRPAGPSRPLDALRAYVRDHGAEALEYAEQVAA